MKTLAEKKKITKEDLFFHSVHGLCRVAGIERSGGSKKNYSLLPVLRNAANKTRFVIPCVSLESSGFNKLISAKEANAILEYFKTGKKKPVKANASWELAEMIYLESTSKDPLKFAKKRQILERAVKGLTGELAVVLGVTLADMAQTMRKNLSEASAVNPLILTLLTNVEQFCVE